MSQNRTSFDDCPLRIFSDNLHESQRISHNWEDFNLQRFCQLFRPLAGQRRPRRRKALKFPTSYRPREMRTEIEFLFMDSSLLLLLIRNRRFYDPITKPIKSGSHSDPLIFLQFQPGFSTIFHERHERLPTKIQTPLTIIPILTAILCLPEPFPPRPLFSH
jgi:hypothetical protein